MDPNLRPEKGYLKKAKKGPLGPHKIDKKVI